MDLRHLPHLEKKAARIHAAIRKVTVFTPPEIRYPSESGAEATIRLLRQRFRKPLMAKQHAWAKQLIFNDVKAYAFLSQYIELQCGEQHWTSWGMLVHPLEQLNPNVAKVLLGNIGPCYLRIDLSNFSVPFQGLLENLKTSKTASGSSQSNRVA